MIFPQQFEEKIGFNRIRQLLNEYCLSSMGEEKVNQMVFLSDFESLISLLRRTHEMERILKEQEEFPVDHFIDCRDSLRKIRIEGTFMDESELYNLFRSLKNIEALVRFFQREEHEQSYPELSHLASDVIVLPEITRQIDSILDKFGHIKDNASPTLARIRREIADATAQVSKTLHAILRNAQAEGYVDKDVAPSMRDGRLVIPIAPSYKRKIRGIVHDESATGKTVYVEPTQVVEANNKIRHLEGEERREVVRILTEITNTIRPHLYDLSAGYDFLAEIEFDRAKALFATEINASLPNVSAEPIIVWQRAIHPLLYLSLRSQDKEVIPLDIELTEEQHILLISGPNAGGKSVCLKSVGLIQYMLQCGLLLPVMESSRMGLFENLFIDIGDEQSIENDLSTYSSHLTNMKFFVRNANQRTLLLIDEFGGGTEPQIGGAIAESLLERFVDKGSFGVITTHYQNLKHYAEEKKGVINGAMLYDRHEMRPLFKLAIGRPGSSFAIEIARKIGLPEEVIADASDKVGSVYVNMDKYLQDIVRDKNYWEKKRSEVRRKEKQIEELSGEYEQQLDALKKQKREMMEAAKEEAQRLLKESNAIIENTIRKIKESQAQKEKTREARQELEDFRRELEERKAAEIQGEMERILRRQQRKQQKGSEPKATVATPPPTKASAHPEPRKVSFAVGDTAQLSDSGHLVEILSIDGRRATVALGEIKSIVNLNKLQPTSRKVQRAERKNTFISSQTADNMRERKLNFRQEIDVRGMRGEEALQAVMYYIDDAILVGVDQVRVLHGTGNGILRELIRNYLASVQGVAHYHDEHVQFGGAGITVVEFR